MKKTLKIHIIDANSQTKIDNLISRCVMHNIDEIILYIGCCPVYCHNTLIGEPASLSSFDTLAALLDTAIRRNIRVYAWWNAGKIPRYWSGYQIEKDFPNWDTATLGDKFTDFHFLDWRVPTVAPFINDFIKEILKNYPTLAGVTLDNFIYGVPPGSGLEARDLYGNDAPEYLANAAQAGKEACAGNYKFGIHAMLDYYGYYLCQCWDKLLDSHTIDFVITSAYYDSAHTFGKDIKKTFEWAINSWDIKYRPYIIPCIAAMETTIGGEPLRTVQNFVDQYNLCLDFERVGIFDNRVTDEMMNAIDEKSIIVEMKETVQKLDENAVIAMDLADSLLVLSERVKNHITDLRDIDKKLESAGDIIE